MPNAEIIAVDVYASGPCCCSACVPKDATPEQIEAAVNDVNPTGVKSRWKISKDAKFKAGSTNPCVCEHDPARLHVLMEC